MLVHQNSLIIFYVKPIVSLARVAVSEPTAVVVQEQDYLILTSRGTKRGNYLKVPTASEHSTSDVPKLLIMYLWWDQSDCVVERVKCWSGTTLV